MKTYMNPLGSHALLRTLVGVSVFSTSMIALGSHSVFADTPTNDPTGGINIGGLFSTYFQNLANSPCYGSGVLIGVNSVIGDDYFKSECRSVGTILNSLFSTVSPAVGSEAVVGFNTDGTPIIRSISGTGWGLYGNTGIDPSKHFIGTINNADLVFKTNNAKKMTIMGDSNIGVKITGNSDYQKGINLSYDLSLETATTNRKLYFGGNGNGYSIQSTEESTGIDFPLTLNPNGGYVGIGEENPIGILDVSNGGDARMFISDDGDMYLGSSATTVDDFRTVQVENIDDGTSASSVFSAISDGSSIGMYAHGKNNISPLKGYGFMYSASTNGLALYDRSTTSRIDFFTNGDRNTPKMRITSNGNVGIGTTNPGAKLDVAGSLRANNQLISGTSTDAPFIVSSSVKVDYLNADYLDGRSSGNATGNIPVSNGTINTNLNADFLDGQSILYFAPINSPTFTGTPKSVTPALTDNSTNIATTKFVKDQGYITSSIINSLGRSYLPKWDGSKLVNSLISDNGISIGIGQINPAYKLDVSGSIRTTNQFISSVTTGAPLSVASTTRVANLNADLLDGNDSTYFAKINSPVFTGDPQAPTPSSSDNDRSIATTEYVNAQGYVRTPPICTGGNKALQWNGSNWSCVTLSVAPANSCATQPSYAHASFVTGTPTSPNQSWVQGASNCGYSCTGGYSGVDCSIAPTTFTYSWSSSSWGSCNPSCGPGTQSRSVSCNRNDGVGVTDAYCSSPKPATSQNCNNGSCSNPNSCATQPSYTHASFKTGTPTSSNQSWVKGANDCGYSCTGGYDGIDCNTYTYSWSVTPGTCTKTCGGGTETRTVTCKRNDNQTVNGTYCSLPKPSVTVSCNTQLCPPIDGKCGGVDSLLGIVRWNCLDGTKPIDYKYLSSDYGVSGKPITWKCEGLNLGKTVDCSGTMPDLYCAPGSGSWSNAAGTKTCDGSWGRTQVGSSATVTDSTGPTTGKLTATCKSGGSWTPPTENTCN